jgi:hypothetical protein
MGKVRQVCSLRIGSDLYTALTNLAREKGTTITEQLERAVRAHLQHATVEASTTYLRPALGEIISDELDAKLGERFHRMQERLAALLAKVAVETGMVLYLSVSDRADGERAYDDARAWAARNVRQKLPELIDLGHVARSEMEALRARLEAEQQARIEAERRLEWERKAHSGEKERADRAQQRIQYFEAVERWYWQRDRWATEQYNSQGVIKRKPLEHLMADFERRTPRPVRPDLDGCLHADCADTGPRQGAGARAIHHLSKPGTGAGRTDLL